MQKLIDSMIEEIEGAENYCTLAHDDTRDSEARRTYKEIGLQEISHFEKLANMYKQKKATMSGMMSISGTDSSKMSSPEDIWFKYFKKKAETLKSKLNEL